MHKITNLNIVIGMTNVKHGLTAVVLVEIVKRNHILNSGLCVVGGSHVVGGINGC